MPLSGVFPAVGPGRFHKDTIVRLSRPFINQRRDAPMRVTGNQVSAIAAAIMGAGSCPGDR